MNPNSMPGPGDSATWPPHVRRADPQMESDDPLDPNEVDEWANAIAHDPAELDALQSGPLNYSLLWVKVAGQYASLYRAYEAARLRSTAGRHDEAEAILRDITQALLVELRRLIVAGKIDPEDAVMNDDGFFSWLAVFAIGAWCSAIVFYGVAW